MPEKESVPAPDVRRRRWFPWTPVAVVLGLAIMVVLEILFLRFGPDMTMGVDAIALFFVGLIVVVWFLSDFLWLQFPQGRIGLGRRDRRPRDGSQ